MKLDVEKQVRLQSQSFQVIRRRNKQNQYGQRQLFDSDQKASLSVLRSSKDACQSVNRDLPLQKLLRKP